MSRRILKHALEQFKEESQLPPMDGEQLSLAFEQLTVERERSLADAVALQNYATQLKNLASQGNYSMEALVLVKSAVAQIGENYQIPVPAKVQQISMESDITPQEQYNIAIEGIGDFLMRIVQDVVVSWKRIWDTVVDSVKTDQQEIAKIRGRLKAAENELSGKSKPKTDAEVSLDQVIDFLSFPAKDAKIDSAIKSISDIKQDADTSNYLLTEVPNAVLTEMASIAKVVEVSSKNADKNKIASAMKSLTGVKKLVNWDKSDKRGLLGKNVVVQVPNKQVNKLDKNDQNIQSVKHLVAGAPYLERSGGAKLTSWLRTVRHSPLAGIVPVIGPLTMFYMLGHDIVGVKSIKFTKQDVLDTIKIGHQYLDGAESYIKNINNYASRSVGLAEDMAKSTTTSGEHGADVKDLFKVLDIYQSDVQKTLTEFCTKEMKRAITGGRFCGYFAMRMNSKI